MAGTEERMSGSARELQLEDRLASMVGWAAAGPCSGPCQAGAWCWRCRDVAEARGALGVRQGEEIRRDTASRRPTACPGCGAQPCTGVTLRCRAASRPAAV